MPKLFFLPSDWAEFGTTSPTAVLIIGIPKESAKISLDVIPAALPEEYLVLFLITLIHFLNSQNPPMNNDLPLMPGKPY